MVPATDMPIVTHRPHVLLSCWLVAARRSRSLATEQQPIHESVRDKKQWHEDGHNEIGRTQLTRLEPNPRALIEGVEEIRAASNIEDPHQYRSQPALKRRQSQ